MVSDSLLPALWWNSGYQMYSRNQIYQIYSKIYIHICKSWQRPDLLDTIEVGTSNTRKHEKHVINSSRFIVPWRYSLHWKRLCSLVSLTQEIKDTSGSLRRKILLHGGPLPLNYSLSNPGHGWLYAFSSFPSPCPRASPLSQWLCLLMLKPFELDLRYLGQKLLVCTIKWVTVNQSL